MPKVKNCTQITTSSHALIIFVGDHGAPSVYHYGPLNNITDSSLFATPPILVFANPAAVPLSTSKIIITPRNSSSS